MSGVPELLTRRVAQSPRMKRRMSSCLVKTAQQVHRRRLEEWLGEADAPYPQMEDSLVAAELEIEQLCEALGPLVTIDPLQFDSDRVLIHQGVLFGLDDDGEDPADSL